MLFVAALFAFVALVSSHPHYQTLIPNGMIVPSPCGGIWAGVGHQNSSGGGALNPFGVDFAAAGHMWNDILCQADSDGDGRTNGAELGDEHCHWHLVNGEGHGHIVAPIGHPGICEPITSPQCANDWFTSCA